MPDRKRECQLEAAALLRELAASIEREECNVLSAGTEWDIGIDEKGKRYKTGKQRLTLVYEHG
ncbi:hypothetical protein ACVA51_13465 [Pseudomonas luteola]